MEPLWALVSFSRKSAFGFLSCEITAYLLNWFWGSMRITRQGQERPRRRASPQERGPCFHSSMTSHFLSSPMCYLVQSLLYSGQIPFRDCLSQSFPHTCETTDNCENSSTNYKSSKSILEKNFKQISKKKKLEMTYNFTTERWSLLIGWLSFLISF